MDAWSTTVGATYNEHLQTLVNCKDQGSNPEWDNYDVLDLNPKWDNYEVLGSNPRWDNHQVMGSNPRWDNNLVKNPEVKTLIPQKVHVHFID